MGEDVPIIMMLGAFPIEKRRREKMKKSLRTSEIFFTYMRCVYAYVWRFNMKKYVYSFNEGSKDMRSLLGGKGANLAEMTKIGMPVPQGFTVTTESCNK